MTSQPPSRSANKTEASVGAVFVRVFDHLDRLQRPFLVRPRFVDIGCGDCVSPVRRGGQGDGVAAEPVIGRVDRVPRRGPRLHLAGLDGHLAERLEREGPLSAEEATRIVTEVARSPEYARASVPIALIISPPLPMSMPFCESRST